MDFPESAGGVPSPPPFPCGASPPPPSGSPTLSPFGGASPSPPSSPGGGPTHHLEPHHHQGYHLCTMQHVQLKQVHWKKQLLDPSRIEKFGSIWKELEPVEVAT